MKIWKDAKFWNWDQDHDVLWKLMNQDPIILPQLSTLIILLKKRKKSDSYEGSDSDKNESYCSEDGLVSEGLDDEIDKNESQKEVNPRLKQEQIREKLRSYYDAGISAAEVITKDIPGLIPRTIYNHFKILNEKRPIQKRKEVNESL